MERVPLISNDLQSANGWQRLDLAQRLLDQLLDDQEFTNEADAELLNVISLFLQSLSDCQLPE